MKIRIIAFIALLSILTLTFAACSKGGNDFAGKTYMYSKYIGDVAFIITINEDNTYSYVSSQEGDYSHGTWTYADDILTLTEVIDEETTIINKFRIEDGQIAFIEDGSDNFPWVRVWNNDKFIDISK